MIWLTHIASVCFALLAAFPKHEGMCLWSPQVLSDLPICLTSSDKVLVLIYHSLSQQGLGHTGLGFY